MNRRSLFRRAGAALAGVLAAMLGIRPRAGATECPVAEELPPLTGTKTSAPCDPFDIDWIPFGAFTNWPIPYSVTLRNTEGEGLRFWLNGQFYVDLPEERYTDTVVIDWAAAEEWEEGPMAGCFLAQCRVRPPDGEWELLRMKRVEPADREE